MTLLYQLAPVPKWTFRDLYGKPLGAGYMLAFSDLNHTVQKLVYTDATGTTPWNSPSSPKILFDLNGMQGPFYWETNPDDPQDLYFIEVYDLNDVFQFSIPHYGPVNDGSASSGTKPTNLQNIIVNNVMNRNFGASALPIATTSIKLALSAHSGLAKTDSNFGPDILFYKNNTAATDQLQFVDFTLGSTELSPDVTPAQYLRYVCSNTPAGETAKYVQFPVTQNVQNLTGSTVTFSIWARANSGSNTLKISIAQFFGDGTNSPSAPVITTPTTFTLTSGWKQYSVTAIIPSTSGKTLGNCGNSGLFAQVHYPTGSSTSIDFTKLCMFAGKIDFTSPYEQYTIYDMDESITNSPRTFDFKMSGRNEEFGWIATDNNSIGSAASNATNRANIDTFPLYNEIWNNVSNTYAVLQDSSGTPVARGASAIDDFGANNRLALLQLLGRVFAVCANNLPNPIGFKEGSRTTTEVPNHTHGFSANPPPTGGWMTNDVSLVGKAFASGSDAFNDTYVPTGTTEINNGGVAEMSLMQPTTFMNFYFKL